MANKAELIKKVSEELGVSVNGQGVSGTAAVNAVIESIEELLAEDGEVKIVGFGNFEVRDRSARKGRNPQTGEEIDIPAKKAPAFKPSDKLKELVAGN